MKKILQRICSLTLAVILVCANLPVSADAAFQIPGTCLVQTDTGAACTVKTLDYSYDNNAYLSLRDVAMALKDTDKAFSLKITQNSVTLTPGSAYKPVGAENVPWQDTKSPGITLRRNEFKVGSQTVFYYTMIVKLPSGYYDCFMMAADLAMILDVDMIVPAEGSLQINTQDSFHVSPDALEQAGYFYGVNSVLAGDATTGEVYYRYQSDAPYPIASTSKLMTCLLAMDAIYAGQIGLDDQVTVSEAAQILSSSSDGVIPLKAGQQVTVRDLLFGTLLPSSNECALCLAEAIAGSEENFVRLMNQKAADLGLSQAVFFNSHGLPSYTAAPIPSKRQNRMSAEDMFRLVSYLLRVYPQITNITSLQGAILKSFNKEVRNSNPLLYNLPGVTGLKTGTTNKAGACLVTSLTADDGVMEHDLTVIVLGTEDSIERGRVSGLLARYALNTFYERIDTGNTGSGETVDGETPQAPGRRPMHAEAAVDRILRTAKLLQLSNKQEQ